VGKKKFDPSGQNCANQSWRARFYRPARQKGKLPRAVEHQNQRLSKLKKNNISLDRKVLADLAVNNKKVLSNIITQLK